MHQSLMIYLSLVFVFSSMLAGLVGFGTVLLSLPLMALFLDIKTVTPLTVLIAISTHSILSFYLWKHFNPKKIWPLVVGTLMGIAPGLWCLKFADKNTIEMILGVTLLMYSIWQLSQKKGRTISEKCGYLFGLISGFLGGAIGTSGPPVIVYTSLMPWKKDSQKATLHVYFLLSGLIVIACQAILGLVKPFVIECYFMGLPALILGTFLGSRLYAIAGNAGYRKIVLGVLMLMGGFIIIRSYCAAKIDDKSSKTVF